MNEMKFTNETIELAMDFIKSVEERMIELKNNPDLLSEVKDKHDCLYHDNQEVKVLTAERFLTLCLKDGRIISIRELNNYTVGELSLDNKREKEIEQGVELFKEIMKLANEKYPLLRSAFDTKAINNITVKKLSGEQEEIVFNPTTTILFLRSSIIHPGFRSTSYKAKDISRTEMEKRLSKIPAFIGFVKAHRFENTCSSCMAFNYDILLQDCNPDLPSCFEDLKSITYDSDSK